MDFLAIFEWGIIFLIAKYIIGRYINSIYKTPFTEKNHSNYRHYQEEAAIQAELCKEVLPLEFNVFEMHLKDVFASFGNDYTEYTSISRKPIFFQSQAKTFRLKYKYSFLATINEICQGIANDENFHINYEKVQEKQREIDELVITKLADNDLIQKHETAFKQNIWLLQIEVLQKYKTKKITELNSCNRRILQQVLAFELSQTRSDEAKKEALNMKLSLLDEFLMANQQNQNIMKTKSDKANDLGSCGAVTLKEWIPDVCSKSIIEYERDYFNFMQKLSIYDENNATRYNALKNEIYEIIVKCFYTAMNEYSKK